MACTVEACIDNRGAIANGESGGATASPRCGATPFWGGAIKAVVRAAGAITHAGLAHLHVTGRPAFGRGPGHVEVLGGPNDRPAVIDDQTRKQQSPAWG